MLNGKWQMVKRRAFAICHLRYANSPQPPSLPDGSYAARVGVSEAELAAHRLAKVQTVDIDPSGHVITRWMDASGTWAGR